MIVSTFCLDESLKPLASSSYSSRNSAKRSSLSLEKCGALEDCAEDMAAGPMEVVLDMTVLLVPEKDERGRGI